MNLQIEKLNDLELETISGGSYTTAVLLGASLGTACGIAIDGIILCIVGMYYSIKEGNTRN